MWMLQSKKVVVVGYGRTESEQCRLEQISRRVLSQQRSLNVKVRLDL